MAAAYVKVYSRPQGLSADAAAMAPATFHKDGYTDRRGRCVSSKRLLLPDGQGEGGGG